MPNRLPIKIVDQDEAEEADMVVCLRLGAPSPFTDNLVSPCADCGHPVIHRPHVPSRPPKVCLECATMRGQGSHGH